MKKAWTSLGVSGQGALAVIAVGAAFLTVRGIKLGVDERATPDPRASITEFKLLSTQSRFAGREQSAMPIPAVEYFVEVPNRYKLVPDAEIVGADGRRLTLDTLSGTTGQCKYSRTGYSFAPPSPRLVLSLQKEVVFETPVDPLPAPTRTIPLVVPLRDDCLLQAVDRKTAGNLPPGMNAYVWRLKTPKPVKNGWLGPTGLYPSIARTEWPTNRPVYSPYTPEGDRLFSSMEADLGGFAEVVTMDPQVLTEAREIDVEVEIYERGNEAGFRILAPAQAVFSDHARFTFMAEDRKIGRNRQGKLSRNVSLPIGTERGYAGLIQDPARIQQFDLPFEGHTRLNAYKPGANSNRLELVSPSLADLGIARMQWGTEEILAPAKKDLVMGRHRLRFRVTHAIGVANAQRQFIRIEPQPSVGPGTNRNP